WREAAGRPVCGCVYPWRRMRSIGCLRAPGSMSACTIGCAPSSTANTPNSCTSRIFVCPTCPDTRSPSPMRYPRCSRPEGSAERAGSVVGLGDVAVDLDADLLDSLGWLAGIGDPLPEQLGHLACAIGVL